MGEILHIPVDRELSDRSRWLITLRWLVLIVAAIFALVANASLGNVLPTGYLWGTLIAILTYNVIFWVIAHRLVSRDAPYESQALLVHAQIITDLVALTTLLHFSGGLENPFATYYVLLVVVGSILMTKRASYAYATVATLLWVGLLVVEATGVLPHYNLQGFRLPVRYKEVNHIVAVSFVLASANFGATYLSSSIITRLREGERQLFEANSSCQFRAAELVELNERLRRLDQTRSFFMRVVTHELRAPVAAIQSYLRLILDGYVPKERVYEIVGKAEQRARDQLDLIGDLLDLAQLQEPKDRSRVKPSDCAAILNDVMDMMQARIDDKSLSISVKAESHLPLVLADAEDIKHIWINLISNAVKYTPEGGSVSVVLQKRNGYVVSSVQDTGIGIAPEDQERIFETFYRTEAAKAMSRTGTGLGLSIVKGIAERYGGRVWLESEVGRGSTFSFELPTAPGAGAKPTTSEDV